jgi:hypothetical protein
MKLLFKRDQGTATTGKALFKLWGKIDLDELEAQVVQKYSLDKAILIEVEQPKLIRNSAMIGFGAFVGAYLLLLMMGLNSAFVALVLGAGGGYFYYHQKRETIFVKDLMHGRYFTCDSVIELARKEAWLQTVVAFLRQVMESAKHWDGTETHDVPVLDKDAAKQLIVQGL